MTSQLRNAAFGASLIVFAASPVLAQQVPYQPVDLSFESNPVSPAPLLAIRKIQNQHRNPSIRKTNAQAEIFANQLQSRLFSALSWRIADAIFGDSPQHHGAIAVGAQTIVFDRGLEDVTLTITDQATGAVTSIVVPTFVDAP